MMKLCVKNDFISSIYEELAGDVDDNKLLLAMVANQILEGVYFYSGFTAIYALARAGKMLGSAQMIRFIQRDEITHLLLFQNMINSVRKERPDLFHDENINKIYDMFKKLEILRSNGVNTSLKIKSWALLMIS